MLWKSILTIISLQAIVALPFLKLFGGKTDLSTYMYYAKYLGGDQ